MELIDISMNINSDMKVYKNREEKKPKIIADKRIPNDSINESVINMNLHTGTHIDAPFHIFENGKTVETLDINDLFTMCKVFDLTHLEDKITDSDIEKLDITKDDFVIFKTKNSFSDTFDFEFVYVDNLAANLLVEIGVKGIGIDALGIERAQEGHQTHKILLSRGIYILEGLCLKTVEDGKYKLVALPLKIDGADGSPVRAILIR